MRTLLRSRVVLPISRPPIENGAVLISDDRILKVGAASEFSDTGHQVVDLGDSILLPGLINAHCHLDYTDMAGLIAPQKYFSDWIKAILALKANWSYSEYGKSWTSGAEMLLRTGTTTVADIEAVPELLPEVWQYTPLRIFSFLEMTGVKSNRAPEAILAEALSTIANLSSDRHMAGLSPHSLYSTTPELIRRSAALAQERSLRLTTHVAESKAEFEMFKHQRGPLFDWLKGQRDVSDCADRTPIEQLELLNALSPAFLAVHVNYLGENDAAILARHGASVVHCPQSHAYFKHDKFPLEELQTAGVNVCLGTDSLASTLKASGKKPTLNLFDEMRTLVKASDASPQTIVEMATINGAKALGLSKLGLLAEQASADLIAVPLSGNVADAYDSVVHFRGNVAASMISGRWAIAPTA